MFAYLRLLSAKAGTFAAAARVPTGRASAAIVLLALLQFGASGALAQTTETQCGSGIICQGSGCDKDENNPNDNLNFSLTSGQTVRFDVKRLPNDPLDSTKKCVLGFSSTGSSGSFTPAAETDPLGANETDEITYTASANGDVKIKIGPPTSSGEQECQLPSLRKAFRYTAFCSFTPPEVTLTLEKDIAPNSDPGTFNLFIESNDGQTVLGSAAGVGDGGDTGPVPVNSSGNSDAGRSYRIRETAAAGTNLSDYTTTLTCDQNVTIKSGSPTDTNGARVTITEDATGNFKCTIKNERKGARVKVVKNVSPTNDPGQFDLQINGSTVFANARHGDASAFVSVAAGEVTVSETGFNTANYDSSISCDNGESATPATSVKFDVQNGDPDVTCTITNRRKTGTTDVFLTLIKKVSNAGGGTAKPEDFTLTFTGPGGSNSGKTGDPSITNVPVAAGFYTFRETGPPAYKLTSLTCNGTPASNGINITSDPKTVTCEFENAFDPKDDRMEEETKRFIHRRVDNLLTHGPDRARMLRRLQEGQQESLKDGPSDAIPPLKFVGRSGAAGSAAATASGLGSPLAASQAKGPITSFAANGAPLGLGINQTESEFEQSRRKSTGNAFFDAVAAQASQMATNSSGFKFGSSLSELRAMAKQHEEQSQKRKIEAAGLNYSGVAITTPRMEPKPGFDVWVEGHISRYNDGLGGVNREGHFRILYAGADYIIKPGFLIGALVQIDDTEEKLSQPGETGAIEGTGWMAGPYLGWRILPNLFFDMRGAWGTSNNRIELNDGVARTGEFKTERWLATATLTGNELVGAWRLSPQIGIAYGHEEYDSYKNSLGQTINGGEASIGRVTGKMEVGYRIRALDGTRVEPHLAIAGIWNFDTDNLVINGATVSSNENRARLEGGVIVTATSGWSVRAAAHYDGIGAGTFESYGGSFWLNMPLN